MTDIHPRTRTTAVMRVEQIDAQYFVQRQLTDFTWQTVSKGFNWPTSAWADLGKRLMARPPRRSGAAVKAQA